MTGQDGERPTGRDLPQPDRPVRVGIRLATGEQLPVRAESDRADASHPPGGPAGRPGEGAELPAGRELPHPQGRTGAARGQQRAVRAERCRCARSRRGVQGAQPAAGSDFGDADRPVRTTGRQQGAVRTEGHRPDPRGMPVPRQDAVPLGGQPPQPYRIIGTAGGDHRGVRAEGHRPDAAGVARQDAGLFAGGDVPQADQSEPTRCQSPAVRAERHRLDPTGVARHGMAELTGGRVPDADDLIRATGREQGAVRADCDRSDPACVALCGEPHLARDCIPEVDGSVGGPRGHHGAVRAERHRAHLAGASIDAPDNPRVIGDCIPEVDGSVGGPRGKQGAVRAERHRTHLAHVPGQGAHHPTGPGLDHRDDRAPRGGEQLCRRAEHDRPDLCPGWPDHHSYRVAAGDGDLGELGSGQCRRVDPGTQ